MNLLYLNHKNLNDYWVLDIEADSLDPKTIWCICLINAGHGERLSFCRGDVHRFRDWVPANPAAIFVTQNGISFDIPALNRLIDAGISNDRIVDTLVLSYLYNPRMPGGHSLEAWGERLKFPKGDYSDWSHFTEEMLEYCFRDCELTLKVFSVLTKRMRERGFSEKSCELEHEIRVVIDKQEKNGFYFEIEKAEALQATLLARQLELEGPIRELFPPVLEVVQSYKYRTKKDGTPFGSYLRHLGEYPEVRLNADGSYDCYDWVTFNIGSPKQRVEKLLSLGWKPNKFTKKTEKGGGGNPQVDEESLIEFSEKSKLPEIKAIADWLVLQGRASMLGTWLNAVNRETHRMHGRVFSCGAGSRRMTHRVPNSANCPKAKPKVPYGKEMRECWSVGDKINRRLVGYDAKGLENCMLAHYLGTEEARIMFTENDSHAIVTELLGFAPEMRDMTIKNGWYAMVFGAQDQKLGTTFKPELSGKAAKDFGKWARSILWDKVPGLGALMKQIQREYDKNGGWLECIDGGYVRCPSPHAGLNYKLQPAGGIVMKQASIILDRWVTERSLDCLKVADIHDEGQWDCAKECAEEFGKLACAAITRAGEILNLKVPLAGDYKVGIAWHETH